jgi:allantoin racemase
MRLLLINPNTTESMTAEMVGAARRTAAPGTEVVGATVEASVPFIDGYADEALAGAAVARLIAARRGEFDAAIVACFGDPGLYAARELSDVPVVGIAEASFYWAMAVAHRFAVVTTIDRGVPGTWDLLRHYGVESRCAAVVATGLDVLDIDTGDASVDAIEAAGRAALDAGAEALCLGCGAMVGAAQVLEQRLGVPVIEAVPSAVTAAESLVRLGLRTSKRTAFRGPVEAGRPA